MSINSCEQGVYWKKVMNISKKKKKVKKTIVLCMLVETV